MTETIPRLAAALADRYRLERELGGGGMSRVFLATETALGREVVVKVLTEELSTGVSAERFAREIGTAARLQQANIVPVLTAGDAAGLAYYTMPFVRGESLRARIASGALPTMAERISILRDIARALAYAHSEKVVHRDIKPENVLLSHGTAMVTDFGIAKAITAARTQEGGTAAATLTQAGGTIGTPAYMAPEQAIGDAVDHRTDLYAWGVLAYELLSGAHPFARHRTAQQLIAAHITEPPRAFTPAAAVPPAVASVVMRCLAKDAGQRPASAAEVLAALDQASTPATSTPARISSPRRVTGLVVVAALLVITFGIWALGQRERTPASAVDVAEQSLAVLPLANLSGDPADDYFGIGLAEEITRALAKNGVRVIGRVSAGALQARGLDERAIAKELGVTSLLTGTVQRADGQVRINVSLVSATDGAVRWTERYDRPLANVFAVQDEISRTVSDTLLGSLGRRASAVRTETTDPEAHGLYLQGMVLFNRRGARQLQQSISLFERASARDPRYARPQAALAMALAVLPAYVLDSTGPIAARAIAAAGRAIAMDSTIAESYVALGYAHSLLDELDKAELDFRKALSLDSMSTAWGWWSLLAARRGDFKAAHERAAKGLALEPASLIARVWEAQNLEQEGRFRESDSASAAAIALDSTFTLAWVWRAYALLAMGQTAPAIALLERQVALLPAGRPEDIHGILAYAYARAGRGADARRMLDSIRDQSGGRLPSTGAIAAALEELGDHEAAVSMLIAAAARHDVWTVQFPRSERYAKLRRDPRIRDLLDRLGRKAGT